RAGRWPLPKGLSINRRALPYEPTFAVVDVIGDGGARIGTVANVSIHPVVLGPECLAVSSDWVGPFRTELERRSGGTAIRLSGAIEDATVDGTHVILAGLTPEWHGYLPCPFGEGYEESTSYGRDAVAAIADALTH